MLVSTRTFSVVLLGIILSFEGLAREFKRITAEIDPIAPTSSIYEAETTNNAVSKWGGNVDFNVGGFMSTGPELWLGNFTVKGPEAGTQVRREDFWPGEKHKLDGMRFRWNFAFWENGFAMKGWYWKFGYSYLKVQSKANRITEGVNSADALPTGVIVAQPQDDVDLVTDTRHGAMFGFGQRWTYFTNKLTLTIGISHTAPFKRIIGVDSEDANAQEDYESLIEDLQDTRLSARPMPEAKMSFGLSF